MQAEEWVAVTGNHSSGTTTAVDAFAWRTDSEATTIRTTGELIVRRSEETVAYLNVERWVYEGLRQWAYKNDRAGFDRFFVDYVQGEYATKSES